MSAPEFAIKYPLFALKLGNLNYAAIQLAQGPQQQDRRAVPIFTSEKNAREYRQACEPKAEVQEFDREQLFRLFLQGLRDKPLFIAFDPCHVGNRRVRSPILYPVAAIEEHLLSVPMSWNYPVYVLLGWGGNYFCHNGRYTLHDGSKPPSPTKAIVVLTDADLADREMMTHLGGSFVSVPIESHEEFVNFLRRMDPSIQAVLFDPPNAEVGRWTTGKMFRFRDALIADLEAKL